MQQTPVRFYITQSDDQPIVRTIPVATHPVPQVPPRSQPAPEQTPERGRTHRSVAKLVRSAVKRNGAIK